MHHEAMSINHRNHMHVVLGSASRINRVLTTYVPRNKKRPANILLP